MDNDNLHGVNLQGRNQSEQQPVMYIYERIIITKSIIMTIYYILINVLDISCACPCQNHI